MTSGSTRLTRRAALDGEPGCAQTGVGGRLDS